jgi:hypothetical protein
LPYHHASAIHLLRLLHIRRIRAKDPPLPRSSMWAGFRDPRGDFSFDVQPVLLAVFCPRLSSALVWSFEAIPNRPQANIKHAH